MTLAIRRINLYKHGLGFFERAGQATASFALEFPRRAMDDALKSLAVIPEDAVVLGVAFETPPDRNPAAQRQPLAFDPPISGLLQAFAGSRAMIFIGERSVTGEIIGLETEEEKHLERALLAVSSEGGIELIPLAHITKVALLDDRAQADLEFALTERRRDTERATARVTLSQPSEVEVSYIAPAPAWRVSYRLLAKTVENDPEAREIFVQGWGLFDNTLEEDLENVELTLTAGMPVSFRYELHAPNTPERPLVRDEQRTVSAPVEFDAMPQLERAEVAMDYMMAAAPMKMEGIRLRKGRSAESFIDSAPAQATGEAKGALFAYKISTPVSVKRGESGMVSILNFKTRGSRELLYNPQKTGANPTASLRFKNQNLTLERGPCTILDNADYAGEAVVPFSPSGAEVILAFAVELGIKISSQVVQRSQTTKLSFKDSSLFMDIIEHQDTTYEALSQLEQDAVITLEHPRWYNSQLQQKPLEETLEFARYKLSAIAQKRTILTITETRLDTRYQDIRSLDAQTLQQFFAERLLDAATLKTLEGMQAKIYKISQLELELSHNQNEKSKVRQRMEDTRLNLVPLTSPQDVKLRQRLVTQLGTLEDAMQQLEQRDGLIETEKQKLEQEIDSIIKRL